MPPPAALTSRYAIVIDAGSSGSRLQIYSWKDPEVERREVIADVKRRRKDAKGKGKEMEWRGGETEEMEVERALKRLVKVGKGASGEDWVKRVEPGISTIQPSQMSTYLSPLLTHALQQIPPSLHPSTPIYLLATAGMRLLTPSAQSALLSSACRILRSDYPFTLDSRTADAECGESVRVISGEEEGMWGWVAVNYLMDGFGHPPKDPYEIAPGSDDTTSHLLPLAPLVTESSGAASTSSPTLVDPTHRSPTFGFLDMGGASTQLAFSPTLEELAQSNYPSELLRSVKLRLLTGETVEWPVFVASWLGFGTNRVRERYEEKRIQEWRNNIALQSALLDAPTPLASDLSNPIEDPCLPKSLLLPSHVPNTPSFLGTGSFSSCLTTLAPLLSLDDPCPPPHTHCLFAGLPTPHIDFERADQRGFIGVSEYWYTAEQVLGLGGVWDWGEWERGMEGFCGRDWGDLEANLSEVDRGRLEMQCFKGAWISNVLHEGIGVPRLGMEKGGNETLTGEEGVGGTNDEAERRAKGKGLMEGTGGVGKGKSHFQSLDSIGETAVSWTLGKMVIEASKAVHLHGHQEETPGIGGIWRWSGAGKLPFAWGEGKERLEEIIGLDHVRLAGEGWGFGREAVWAYWGLVGGLLVWLWWKFRGTKIVGKRRKPSDVGQGGGYVLAESGGLSPSIRGKPFMGGTFRSWGYRLSEMARRVGGGVGGRPTPSRHQSMPPLGLRLPEVPKKEPTYSSSSAMSSQPSSPGIGGPNNHFFTPAYAAASPPRKTTPYPSSDTGGSGVTTPTQSSSLLMRNGPIGGSSLRGSIRRQTSQILHSSDGLPISSSGGWNDPPFVSSVSTMYGRAEEEESSRAGSILMPPTLSVDGPRPMSRQSSRMNLSDMSGGAAGLNARPVSRGTTPSMDDPDGF